LPATFAVHKAKLLTKSPVSLFILIVPITVCSDLYWIRYIILLRVIPSNRIVGVSYLQVKLQVIHVKNGFSVRCDRFSGKDIG
jgi:hypothetical protein